MPESTVASVSPQMPRSGRKLTFALVGNPNCGKSTLFNALTGMRQKVGNYPGVTVEKKIGELFSLHGKPLQLIDLPGAYSLTPRSPDEAVTRDVLLGRLPDMPRPDRVIVVVDSSNLERNLFFVTQVMDLGLPTIVALNMGDLAEARGVRIEAKMLEDELGIPVIPCQAHRNLGLVELKQAISREEIKPAPRKWKMSDQLESAVSELAGVLARHEGRTQEEVWLRALLILCGESEDYADVPSECRETLGRIRERLKGEGIDAQEASVMARYDYLQQVCERVSTATREYEQDYSDKLDSVLTHPIWGTGVFLALMGFMFFSIFTVATYPMDWVDQGFGMLGNAIRGAMPAGDLRDLITDGVIAGVGGVMVFLPQILILFFFIGLLEDTGYMARAAFLMDRVMSRVGLHGKSFIPLLSSYACAIPGIMATRTIENPKDRLVTILVAPLMSCSARLPVYTVMIATLLPPDQVSALQKAGILLALYLFGTGAAFFFAWLFKKTIMKSETPVLIMELPQYRWPSLKSVAMQMWSRSALFVRRAGTVILGLSIILWFLMTFPKSDAALPSQQLADSFAGQVGHVIEPVIKPLGFDWKIGIGLIGSFAAREVFVSTMSVIYNVQEAEDVTVPLRDAMRRATWPDGSAVYTPLVCISLLVFYVLALQCVSTIAVVKRETNGWRWPLFQLAYMTGFAYVASLLVFQIGSLMGY